MVGEVGELVGTITRIARCLPEFSDQVKFVAHSNASLLARRKSVLIVLCL